MSISLVIVERGGCIHVHVFSLYRRGCVRIRRPKGERFGPFTLSSTPIIAVSRKELRGRAKQSKLELSEGKKSGDRSYLGDKLTSNCVPTTNISLEIYRLAVLQYRALHLSQFLYLRPTSHTSSFVKWPTAGFRSRCFEFVQPPISCSACDLCLRERSRSDYVYSTEKVR